MNVRLWENGLYPSMDTDHERAHVQVRRLPTGSSVGVPCSEQRNKPQLKVLKVLTFGRRARSVIFVSTFAQSSRDPSNAKAEKSLALIAFSRWPEV